MEFKLEEAQSDKTKSSYVDNHGRRVVIYPCGRKGKPDLRVLAHKDLLGSEINAVREAHAQGLTVVRL